MTKNKEIYYWNFETSSSQWEHPCDEMYKNLCREERNKIQITHIEEDKDDSPVNLVNEPKQQEPVKVIEEKHSEEERQLNVESIPECQINHLEGVKGKIDKELTRRFESYKSGLEARLEKMRNNVEVKEKEMVKGLMEKIRSNYRESSKILNQEFVRIRSSNLLEKIQAV